MMNIVSSNIHIRPLNPREWELFRDIRMEALWLENGNLGCTVAFMEKHSEKDWREWIEGQHRCVMGAFDQHILIGITTVVPWESFMILLRESETWRKGPSDLTAFIKGGYVKSEYRGLKLGRRLHLAAVEWVNKDSAYTRTIIGHRASIIAGKKIIADMGFEFIEKQMYSWADGTDEEVYMYRLDMAG